MKKQNKELGKKPAMDEKNPLKKIGTPLFPSQWAMWYFEDAEESQTVDGQNFRYGTPIENICTPESESHGSHGIYSHGGGDDDENTSTLVGALRSYPSTITLVDDPYNPLGFSRVSLEILGRRDKRAEERNLRRIDVVKQLFEAFLNRSAAYGRKDLKHF